MAFDLRIDGDVLCYRAGFAADSNSEELSHSLYNAKSIIMTLRRRFPGKCTIVLSSSDPKINWRSSLTHDYKMNRIYSNCCDDHVTYYTTVRDKKIYKCVKCKEVCKTHSIKPKYFKEIKEYLIKRWDAKIVPWGEADDWLGVNQKEGDTTIIASIDKDLLMLPGYHYRMQSDKVLKSEDPGKIYLSEDRTKIMGVGFIWWAAQMFLGDKVDNIHAPKKGFGPVKVHNLFKEVDTKQKAWELVLKHYKEHEDLLELNGKLLWIAREARQIWSKELMEELCQK